MAVGFKKHGASGIEISDLYPHLARQADRLCVIRSMQTEQINHDTGHAFMNTGSIITGRPSMGSWLLYGLGSPTGNLPGFIVLTSAGRHVWWSGGRHPPCSRTGAWMVSTTVMSRYRCLR